MNAPRIVGYGMDPEDDPPELWCSACRELHNPPECPPEDDDHVPENERDTADDYSDERIDDD